MTLLFSLFVASSAHAGWFKDFCEKHIVSEHPFQTEIKRLPTQELVELYRQLAGQKYWRKETSDEFEMTLAEMLARWRYPGNSDLEKIAIYQALKDYPTWQTEGMFQDETKVKEDIGR